MINNNIILNIKRPFNKCLKRKVQVRHAYFLPHVHPSRSLKVSSVDYSFKYFVRLLKAKVRFGVLYNKIKKSHPWISLKRLLIWEKKKNQAYLNRLSSWEVSGIEGVLEPMTNIYNDHPGELVYTPLCVGNISLLPLLLIIHGSSLRLDHSSLVNSQDWNPVMLHIKKEKSFLLPLSKRTFSQLLSSYYLQDWSRKRSLRLIGIPRFAFFSAASFSFPISSVSILQSYELIIPQVHTVSKAWRKIQKTEFSSQINYDLKPITFLNQKYNWAISNTVIPKLYCLNGLGRNSTLTGLYDIKFYSLVLRRNRLFNIKTILWSQNYKQTDYKMKNYLRRSNRYSKSTEKKVKNFYKNQYQGFIRQGFSSLALRVQFQLPHNKIELPVFSRSHKMKDKVMFSEDSCRTRYVNHSIRPCLSIFSSPHTVLRPQKRSKIKKTAKLNLLHEWMEKSFELKGAYALYRKELSYENGFSFYGGPRPCDIILLI